MLHGWGWVDPADRALVKHARSVPSIMYFPDNLLTSLAISLCDRDMMRLVDAQLLQPDQFGYMTTLRAFYALTISLSLCTLSTFHRS